MLIYYIIKKIHYYQIYEVFELKLNKHQKDIVKNIANGEITDILSFVKYYNLGHEVLFDKSAVENKFNEIYGGKKFLCDSVHFDNHNETSRIIERVDQRTALCSAKLTFVGPYSHCSYDNIRYSYHLFKPVYITNHIDEIITFIALWQYLKAQALIIELPKSCTKEDMGLFLKQINREKCEPNPLEESNSTPYDYHHLEISYTEFFDGNYELNDENFEICLPYLTQKIYPAPELKNFIQKGYNTTEEINNRRNLGIALAGVIIAILTSLASIYMSAQEKGYYFELNAINNSLQEIKDSISADNDYSTYFDEINNSLQHIQETLSTNTNDLNTENAE